MCDFCENIEEYNGFDNRMLKDGIVKYEEKTDCFLVTCDDSDMWISDELKINYCPMCGRKLIGETEKQSIEELLASLKEKMTEEDYKTLQKGTKSFSDGVNALWSVLGKGIETEN